MMATKKCDVVAPRDQEELEGTLLPPEVPMAHPLADVPAQATPAAAVAAVPVSSFVYTADTTQQASDDVVVTSDLVDNDDDIHAPLMDQYEDTEGREKAESEAVTLGKVKGKIAAEEEIQDIRKASRQVHAIQYHTKRSVEEANHEAQRRNREGVQIKEDKWFGREPEKEIEKPDPDRVHFAQGSGGGYEVSEYQTSSYTGEEYETTEYKSVYEK